VLGPNALVTDIKVRLRLWINESAHVHDKRFKFESRNECWTHVLCNLLFWQMDPQSI